MVIFVIYFPAYSMMASLMPRAAWYHCPGSIDINWSNMGNTGKNMMTSSSGKNFPRCWPFVQWIHRTPVNSHWRGASMFSLIRAWINGWVKNGEAGDLGRHRAHYDVTIVNKPNNAHPSANSILRILCIMYFEQNVKAPAPRIIRWATVTQKSTAVMLIDYNLGNG